MARRFYSNNAPQLTTSGSITAGAITVGVAGSFSGWPVQFPFYAALDIGTASFEIVSVTNGIAGTTATIVRAQDGTAAISHPAGATLDQVVVRQDLDEANAHVNASTGVHGSPALSSVRATTRTSPTRRSPARCSPAPLPVRVRSTPRVPSPRQPASLAAA
jgi:hypothetical protein